MITGTNNIIVVQPYIRLFSLSIILNQDSDDLTWGHVPSIHSRSLPTNGEIVVPTTGTNILMLTIMSFQLWHEIYLKIENPKFCGNQVTPVSRVTNHR